MKQENLLVLAMVVAALAAVTVALLKEARRRKARERGDIRAKKLLTEREQPMFFRLQQAFPQHIVLCQVAFSALITAKDLATRATFNRKFADFVLATKAFEVVAVIELDDSSHRGQEARDSMRDRMLESAGYRVLRFKRIPDFKDLQDAINGPLSPQSVNGTERATR